MNEDYTTILVKTEDVSEWEMQKVVDKSRSHHTYVYLLVDGTRETIFYVGKGCKDRYTRHHRITEEDVFGSPLKSNCLMDIVDKKGYVKPIILFTNLTDFQGLIIEKKVIRHIGLEHLSNMSEGSALVEGYDVREVTEEMIAEKIKRYNLSAIDRTRIDREDTYKRWKKMRKVGGRVVVSDRKHIDVDNLFGRIITRKELEEKGILAPMPTSITRGSDIYTNGDDNSRMSQILEELQLGGHHNDTIHLQRTKGTC